MSALFPEPSTAAKVASVDKLRREAQDKAHVARRARDERTAFYWLNEMVRLDRLRAQVVNGSQQELGLFPATHSDGDARLWDKPDTTVSLLDVPPGDGR